MASKDSKVNVDQEVWDRVVRMEGERKKDPNYESCCGKDNPCSCNTFSPNMPSPEDAKEFVHNLEAKNMMRNWIAGLDSFGKDLLDEKITFTKVTDGVQEYEGRPIRSIKDELGRFPCFEEAGDHRLMSEDEKETMRKAFEALKPTYCPEKFGKSRLPIILGTIGMELPEPKTRLQKLVHKMKNFIKKYKR